MPAPVALTLNLAVAPVDEEEALTGSGEGGIEPVDIIGIEHIIRHVTLIHIHMCPLSALRLVAGYGVCEFHLQGVEELILPDGLHSISLERNILIILFYLMEELLLLFMGQSRRLARQCIQQHRSFQLIVVVIGKLEQQRGKAEAIEVDAAAHLQHFRPIAIRQESRNLVTLNLVTWNLELGTLSCMITLNFEI